MANVEYGPFGKMFDLDRDGRLNSGERALMFDYIASLDRHNDDDEDTWDGLSSSSRNSATSSGQAGSRLSRASYASGYDSDSDDVDDIDDIDEYTAGYDDYDCDASDF